MATSEAAPVAGVGAVISCHSVDEWKTHFQHGLDSKKLVVVDFTASWCGPCRLMAPVIADFAKKLTDVLFFKVDVDEVEAVAKEWEVEAMPTFLFLKEGKLLDKLVGARKDELQRLIEKHAPSTAAA